MREPVAERVPQIERRREVLDLPRRQQQRPLAVDRQHEPREEARVVGEEAARLAGHVAAVVADAERRAFEDGDHALAPRRMLPPEVCASASTTISSMFTFG